MLYFALVYPYLQYCIKVFDSRYATNTNRSVLRKRAVRIINEQGFSTHTLIFYKYNILKFEDIF